MLQGVLRVESGYAGGTTKNPVYQNIGDHAEVIRIEYDPTKITFKDLLTVFFASHDPTTIDRQGADVGHQYRSVVLYTNSQQRDEAEKFIAGINQSSELGQEIVTSVEPLREYYPAEEYHQNYYQRNQSVAYCRVVINPKLKKVKEKFSELLNASD